MISPLLSKIRTQGNHRFNGLDLYLHSSYLKIVVLAENTKQLVELQKYVGDLIEHENQYLQILCIYPSPFLISHMILYHLHNDLLLTLMRQYHTTIYPADIVEEVEYETLVDSYSIDCGNGVSIKAVKPRMFSPLLISTSSIYELIHSFKIRKCNIIVKNLLTLELIQLTDGMIDGDLIYISQFEMLEPKFIEKLFETRLILSDYLKKCKKNKIPQDSINKEFFMMCANKYNYDENELLQIRSMFKSHDEYAKSKHVVLLQESFEHFSDCCVDDKTLFLYDINKSELMKYLNINILRKFYCCGDVPYTTYPKVADVELFYHVMFDLSRAAMLSRLSRHINNTHTIYIGCLSSEEPIYLDIFRKDLCLMNDDQINEIISYNNSSLNSVIEISRLNRIIRTKKAINV